MIVGAILVIGRINLLNKEKDSTYFFKKGQGQALPPQLHQDCVVGIDDNLSQWFFLHDIFRTDYNLSLLCFHG